jgi:hypothetical protein
VNASERADLRDRIAFHLERIEGLFSEPVRISILIRNPAHSDGSRDVWMTSEDGKAEDVFETIRQIERVGELTPKGSVAP